MRLTIGYTQADREPGLTRMRVNREPYARRLLPAQPRVATVAPERPGLRALRPAPPALPGRSTYAILTCRPDTA
jgi:hypothetical protein